MLNNYPEIIAELELVEKYIREKVKSKNKLLTDIVNDLLASGGKRLRPAMTVAAARFGDYNREKTVSVAGALEILHTATLVHDDIIDRAKLRRGKRTVSDKYGIDLAVYTGDFLFSKAVLMLSKDISVDKLDVVAAAVKTICEGEVDQYIDKYNVNTSILSYLKRINKKTAVLFAAACGLGAYTSGCSHEVAKQLARFGFNFGMAFQIRDDINDLSSSELAEGKPVGKDIQEGIMTLPVIIAVRKDRRLFKKVAELLGCRENMPLSKVSDIIQTVKELNGIGSSKEVLRKYIARALKILDLLPQSSSNDMLRDITKGLDLL